MHIHSLDAASLQDLEQLINSHDFLCLSSSKTRFPEAQGSGLPLIEVKTELCDAVISLQGAQLLNFLPAGGKELLWLSPNCDFTPGEALRGGIPLCLPWFGVNQEDPSKQKHGFARNHFWQLASARQLADGTVELEFLFLSDANHLFAYDFSAELRMTLGQSAKLELTINNTDTEDFNCSWAMHNYHAIESLAPVKVKGLAERSYLNNLDNYASEVLAGDLQFNGPVDRVFPNINNSLQIIGNPSIEIEHGNCPSVITWNPGAAAAAETADIGIGQEQFYICVERGAVLSEQWKLAAGSSQSAWLEFKQI
jgi:glucose-6-phosphate 1-epimerase